MTTADSSSEAVLHAPGHDAASDAARTPGTLAYLKGDGTGNDFIVVLDVADEHVISAAAVQAWCDRDRGVGADGLLRIVQRDDDTFFMDYRNADGSLAEICGNGLRVVGHVLRANKLLAPGEHTLGTRGGDVRVTIPADGNITVVMGRAQELSEALTVHVAGVEAYAARAVLMPNPHAVACVADISAVGDLNVSPTHEPTAVLPDGANYEFVEVVNAHHIRMRVFERGVGETKSCGSGACAAALVAARNANLTQPWQMRVDVPGGTLHVAADAEGVLSLTGPAQVTSSGVLENEAGSSRNTDDIA